MALLGRTAAAAGCRGRLAIISRDVERTVKKDEASSWT